jgi:hypothetical protein
VRELYLSPDHAVLVNDVLVPVKLLINGTTIAQAHDDHVRYFHVELPRHAVILAEGLTVESYLDTGDRANFQRDAETIRLFPDFAARFAPETARLWETQGAARLVLGGAELAAARLVLASRPGKPDAIAWRESAVSRNGRSAATDGRVVGARSGRASWPESRGGGSLAPGPVATIFVAGE